MGVSKKLRRLMIPLAKRLLGKMQKNNFDTMILRRDDLSSMLSVLLNRDPQVLASVQDASEIYSGLFESPLSVEDICIEMLNSVMRPRGGQDDEDFCLVITNHPLDNDLLLVSDLDINASPIMKWGQGK